MRTTEQINEEIEKRLGFLPSFFLSFQSTPQMLESFWQQMLIAQIDNPLPPSFKEKLFAYLSRYCANSYWLVCQSCSLYSLGVEAREVLELLLKPAPTEADIELHLKTLARQFRPLSIQSELKTNAKAESLFACATFIFLEPKQAQNCCQQLNRLLGANNYQHLIALLSFIKTCHSWVEIRPDISATNDWRVQNCLNALVEDEPRLTDFFNHYSERVNLERQNREELLLAQIANYKRKEEETQLLQTMTQKIGESQDFHSAIEITLRKVCEIAGWNFGEAWIPHADGIVLECSPAWYSTDGHLKEFRRVSASFKFQKGFGLPGRVWASKQIEWDKDVSAMPEKIYLRAGIGEYSHR
jgi:hypothetical protein